MKSSSSRLAKSCGLALAAAGIVLSLSGCDSIFGGGKKGAVVSDGERIPVIGNKTRKIEKDPGVEDFSPALPEELTGSEWPQEGGSPTHVSLNPELAPVPEKAWKSDIGSGSGGGYKLLARPIVAGGKVFTMDARGEVRAFSDSDGSLLWKRKTNPEKSDGDTNGGGIGYGDGKIFATTGFGEVLALRPEDGSVIWRKTIGKPLRAAPSISDGRVFAVTIDNETHALSVEKGEMLWKHNGISESAALMGAASPAIGGDSVIVAYSSGEMFSLRSQNGRMAWTEVLAVPTHVGALPAIADIRGLPVIDGGLAFAVSHSGRMAAVDMRTGGRAWENEIGGTNTPAVAGDAVFVLSNDNELAALVKESGRVSWVKQLQRFKDVSNKDSERVFWNGPVLAGGRLWMVSSLGRLIAVSVNDGSPLYDQEIELPFFMPPVVAGRAMYLVSDDGQIIAMK